MISRKLVSVRDKEVSNDGAFDFLGHLGHFVRPKQDEWIVPFSGYGSSIKIL